MESQMDVFPRLTDCIFIVKRLWRSDSPFKESYSLCEWEFRKF